MYLTFILLCSGGRDFGREAHRGLAEHSKVVIFASARNTVKSPFGIIPKKWHGCLVSMEGSLQLNALYCTVPQSWGKQ